MMQNVHHDDNYLIYNDAPKLLFFLYLFIIIQQGCIKFIKNVS